MVLKRPLQQFALAGFVRRLKAAQQLVERMEHLFGQALAHFVLELAAVFQQARQPLRARHAQQPGLAEQQAHGGADGPAGGLHHVLHAEVQPAGAFAPGRGDQAQAEAVEQQSGRRSGLPQQALHAPVGGSSRSVKILPKPANIDQQLPRRGFAQSGFRPVVSGLAPVACLLAALRIQGVCRPLQPNLKRLRGRMGRGGGTFRLPHVHGEVRAQHLGGVRQSRFQILRQRRFLRAGVALGRKAPAEHGLGEGAEVRQIGFRGAFPAHLPFLHASLQKPLPLGIPPVEYRPRIDQRRRGQHQPRGPHETQPFQVGGDVGV